MLCLSYCKNEAQHSSYRQQRCCPLAATPHSLTQSLYDFIAEDFHPIGNILEDGRNLIFRRYIYPVFIRVVNATGSLQIVYAKIIDAISSRLKETVAIKPASVVKHSKISIPVFVVVSKAYPFTWIIHTLNHIIWLRTVNFPTELYPTIRLTKNERATVVFMAHARCIFFLRHVR